MDSFKVRFEFDGGSISAKMRMDCGFWRVVADQF